MRKNEELVTAPADKGNVTVVLNCEDYERKASDITGAHLFCETAKDHTNKVETTINKCVRQFFTEGKIQKPTYDWLRTSSCPLPRYDGRMKIHKEGAPYDQ